MTLENALKKYPHIIRAMSYIAILSTYESAGAIVDYKRGENYSGEAVNHFGGIREVIRCAWRERHRIPA